MPEGRDAFERLWARSDALERDLQHLVDLLNDEDWNDAEAVARRLAEQTDADGIRFNGQAWDIARTSSGQVRDVIRRPPTSVEMQRLLDDDEAYARQVAREDPAALSVGFNGRTWDIVRTLDGAADVVERTAHPTAEATVVTTGQDNVARGHSRSWLDDEWERELRSARARVVAQEQADRRARRQWEVAVRGRNRTEAEIRSLREQVERERRELANVRAAAQSIDRAKGAPRPAPKPATTTTDYEAALKQWAAEWEEVRRGDERWAAHLAELREKDPETWERICA